MLARSSRRTAPIAVGILVCAAVILPGCGGSDESGTATGADGSESATYSKNGVSFRYPSEWEEFSAQTADEGGGASNELWNASVGIEESDLVGLTAYQLNFAVDEQNIADIGSEVTDLVRQIVAEAGAEIDSPPAQTEIAGYPAYQADWSGVDVEGEPKSSHATFVFVDDVEYFFNCQYGPEAEEELLAGCDAVLDSFEVTAEGGR